MKQVERIDEIHQAINQIKNSPEWFTNLYVNDSNLENWIKKGQIYIQIYQKAIFLVRRRPEFYQFYFLTVDLLKFKADLKQFLKASKDTYAVAILGNVEVFHELLQEAGLTFYMGINRVSKITEKIGKPVLKKGISFAVIEDALDIQQMMYDMLDIYCDQIPDIDEIEAVIRKKGVIIIRNEQNRDVEAFVCFKRKGVLSQAYYLAAKEKYRDKRVGMIILNAYFAYNADARRHIGWIRDNNIASQAVNYRFGLKPDGFREEVFIYKGDKL